MEAELFERFSRQVLLKGIGQEGMKRIRGSRVAVIGCGALGSAEAELLARAGVGFLRVVDRDVVDYTNIHRTHMIGEREAEEGKPKALACQEGVKGIDGSIRVEAVIDDVDSDNVEDLVRDVDIVLDGTDNLETRFLINEAAVKTGKPWVYAGVNGWYGTVMFISPGKGPCLRCFMSPEMAQDTSCDVIPTIGTVTTMTGSVAAGLALRYLAGDEPEPGELILIDGRLMNIEKVSVKRDPHCPVCGLGKFEMLSRRPSYGVVRLCGSNTFKVRLDRPINLEEAVRALERANELVIARPGWARVLTKEGASATIVGRLIIIENVKDETAAAQVYNELKRVLGLSSM